MTLFLKIATTARFVLLGVVFSTATFLVFDSEFSARSNMLRGTLIMFCILAFVILDQLYWSAKSKETIDKIIEKIESYQSQGEEEAKDIPM